MSVERESAAEAANNEQVSQAKGGADILADTRTAACD